MDLGIDPSDKVLLQELRKDSQAAFNKLYDRYWKPLLVTASNGLNDREAAEDCVQDIFVSLWNRRAKLELTYSLRTYLAVAVKYQVIQRLARNHAKRNKLTNYLGGLTEQMTPGADSVMLEKELMERLNMAIEDLPERCRIIYRMSREEGLSHKQIAEKLDISEKTVNNQLVKAISSIKGDLSLTLPPIIYYLYFHGNI